MKLWLYDQQLVAALWANILDTRVQKHIALGTVPVNLLCGWINQTHLLPFLGFLSYLYYLRDFLVAIQLGESKKNARSPWPMTPSIDRWSMPHNSPFNYELVFEFIMKQQLKSCNPTRNPSVDIFCLGVCSSSWTFLHVNATRTNKVHAKSCTIYISYICSWCRTQPLSEFSYPLPVP